jgi:hypothetical protein
MAKTTPRSPYAQAPILKSFLSSRPVDAGYDRTVRIIDDPTDHFGGLGLNPYKYSMSIRSMMQTIDKVGAV